MYMKNTEGSIILLQTSGEDLLSTDLQYSDNYLLLASYLLVDIWQLDGNNKQLWQTIVLLERGVQKCPSNHQLKLLLIHLYSQLGEPVFILSFICKHLYGLYGFKFS